MIVKREVLAFQREKIRLRTVFRLLGTIKIKDFTIQIEVDKSINDWKPAIRYDLKAHAQARYLHRDLINPVGRKIDHNTCPKEIPAKSLDDAVAKAIDDLDQNVNSLLTKAGWNEIIDVPYLDPDLKSDLKNSEEYLLNLIIHPENILAIPDKHLLIRD